MRVRKENALYSEGHKARNIGDAQYAFSIVRMMAVLEMMKTVIMVVMLMMNIMVMISDDGYS